MDGMEAMGYEMHRKNDTLSVVGIMNVIADLKASTLSILHWGIEYCNLHR